MRIVMVGTGYVGLVTGVCFADFGHDVICVDNNQEKIALLRKGEMPIYEPGLKEMAAKNVAEKRLAFETNLPAAMLKADAVFIAVGTPARHSDGFADLSYVYAAAEEIAQHISDFTVIVTKSTVPVGTGDEIESILENHCARNMFEVVSNPEFLREGAAIADFKEPDRVVIGTENERATEIMRAIYRPISINGTVIQKTARRTSELIKYAANSFLATKITFINEMADLCEAVGGNIGEVSEGIGLDSRIGKKFLQAGPGYGGSCFPKDTQALLRTANKANIDLSIVEAVVEANDKRKLNMAKKIIDACDGNVEGKVIAILGLSFKPDTDDMRDAASLTILPFLQKNGAIIKAFDPEAMGEAENMLENIIYTEDSYSCVSNADIAVVLTEWDVFRALDIKKIKAALKFPVIVDLRNIYNPTTMNENNIKYTSIHPIIRCNCRVFNFS